MATRLSFFKLALLALADGHRMLSPTDSIGSVMRSERANGNARFSIQAEKTDGTQFAFDVVEASNPALTPDTIIKSNNGESPVGQGVLHALLVSDLTAASGSDTFALLAVDPEDNVHGIVDVKGEKPMKIKQDKGKKATATEETNLVAPDWSCDVDHVDAEGHLFDRRLEEEHGHHEHEHDHDHQHHDHSHDHSIESVMQTLSQQLRGTKINPLNKPRRLQSSSYNYQVDLYIEIDNAFVTNSGGTMNSALNYINSLVTAANQVYENEIDTHLNVAFVDLNSVYDLSTSTSDALSIMRTAYAAGTWHHPVDLHHALLGKDLGGGIAYVGVLCRSDYGYGLTASIEGSFVSLDYRVVWDLVAFMHEIGHNFNSPHSHDTNTYSPAIDTCGTSCPAASTNQKWSTIMSYCHGCSGDYANQMYTFGGSFSGNGIKTDINNWIDDPVLIANGNDVRKSVDPRREAHRMYSHVQSKTASGCLAVPIQPTNAPITPAPVTPKPTNAPITPAPVTPKPTNAPITPQPTPNPTNAPITPAPVTPKPTNAPITPQPTPNPTNAPITPAPVTPKPTNAPITPQPTPNPVTLAPVSQSPSKAPVTQAPISSSPTKKPTTPLPTKMPVTPAPVTSSPTAAPTRAANCIDPSITQQQCVNAPNCEWVKKKGSWSCQFMAAPPSPTPPTTPNPTGGGGGGTCDGTGAPCGNCCNGCQTNGRWANTCK